MRNTLSAVLVAGLVLMAVFTPAIVRAEEGTVSFSEAVMAKKTGGPVIDVRFEHEYINQNGRHVRVEITIADTVKGVWSYEVVLQDGKGRKAYVQNGRPACELWGMAWGKKELRIPLCFDLPAISVESKNWVLVVKAENSTHYLYVEKTEKKVLIEQKYTMLQTVHTAPAIVAGPYDRESKPGATVELSVDADGQDLRYRWFHNGEVIPDEVTPRLTVESFSMLYAGVYIVEVSNARGRILSEPARLALAR